MSSLFSGGSTDSSSQISGLDTIAQGQVQLANDVTNRGNAVYSQGQQIYDPAYGQYTGGIAGDLTDAQQALVSQNLGASNAATGSIYSNLGTGLSTMEDQDKSTNALKSLAEEANINFQNETLGLQGLDAAKNYYGTADQYYNTGTTGYANAATSTYDAGILTNQNLQQLNESIKNLGNKSGSSITGELLSGVENLVKKII